MTDEPAEGHNSALTEDERRALFFHHMRKRMAHDARLEEIKAERKADGKTAQADGVVLGDLDYGIKTLAADDKKTITDRFVAHGEVLTWLGLAPGFQTDLFADRAPAVDRIASEGERAGLLATERKSPYAAGSDEDAAWLRGYDNGQAIMRDSLQSAMEKRNAAKAEAEPASKDDEAGEAVVGAVMAEAAE